MMRVKRLTGLCVVLLFSIAAFAQTASAQPTEEVTFSVTVRDQSLQSVLQDVEQQTGFAIILDGPINSDPVSGVYSNTTISDFFLIALEENDISVSTDPEKKQITISKAPASNMAEQRQEMDALLASEADYISKAKQSVRQPTEKEREALRTDPLTGKPWHEVEPEMRLSPKQENTSSQISEADFLAAES